MAHVTRTAYAADSRSGKLTGIVIVVALHLLVLAALWQLEPVRSALTSTAPIVVSLVEPPRIKPEAPPKPLPPKPRVQAPVPPRVAPAPIVTAAPQLPTPQVTAPPVLSPPPPESVPAPPAPAPVAVAAPPAPLVPPSFNANYLNNPAPAYPPISRRMGEEGKVVLRVRVNERGLPDEVQVKASSGSERLDMTALQTVRHWKFVPARRGDTPVEAWVLVPISFSLRS